MSLYNKYFLKYNLLNLVHRFVSEKIHEFHTQSVRTIRKAHLRSISAGSALRFRLILKIALLPPDE